MANGAGAEVSRRSLLWTERFPVALPPLREREENTPLLIEHFVGKSAKRQGRTFSCIPDEVIAALKCYDLPGNIREL